MRVVVGMPNSLKDKFKSLRNRFLIDDAEYRSMCKKLDGHDKELLDKVMQKQRTIIDDDGVMYRVVFLKDIEDIKSEVQKGAENDRS